MPTIIFDRDWEKADFQISQAGLPSNALRYKVAEAIALEREQCATIALEQRCERGTPWDDACVAIAKAIRESR
jgi:hypothetical protein